MKLTLWTYEGPPHVGAMRVATAMKGQHYVLHAPQGDTYADLLFTMIERRDHRPPVTYTTFQACDLGGDTATLFKTACQDALDRFKPEALIVGASCTAELIQDNPAGLAGSMDLGLPVIALDLPSYQRKEGFGTDETFLQIVRHLAKPCERTPQITCNLIGPTALGFRHRDDITELTRLLSEMGIGINVCAPMGARPSDIARMGAAHFNVLMYPEHAESAARWLETNCKQPFTRIVPIGVGATRDFLAEVAKITGLPAKTDTSRLRLGVVAFLLVIFAAPLQSTAMFYIGAWCIGLGAGLFAVSTLTAAMALPEQGKAGRGLVLGAWGAAQATAAGVSIAIGGGLRDSVSTYAMEGHLGHLFQARTFCYAFGLPD
jgi:light-independent protochlorophyllide reductase subunit B